MKKIFKVLNKVVLVISFFCFGLLFNPLLAQSDSTRLSIETGTVLKDTSHPKVYPQKDLVDVFKSLKKNKRNEGDTARKIGKYHFTVVPAFGYTLTTGWAGIVATNVGFYTSDSARTNVSSISSPIIYTQYNQLTLPILINIWTRDNKYNIVADWRYYKYPQSTYGLGGHTSLDDADLLDYSHVRIRQSFLRRFLPNFYAGAGYWLDYHWNIEDEGPDSVMTDAKQYGLSKTSMSSGPVINVLYDNRKNSINPQGGLYANVLYHPNFTWLGSNSNWQSLTIDVRQYVKFPRNSNNILAFWEYAWLTPSGNPPYLDLPATAWDAYNNTGRGYIQGRFRGKNMLYAEAEYRFQITNNGLIGGVVFANAQSFSNYPKNNIDAIWPGYGLGIRIKANKNSNTNIAIDYGFGLGNSRGFFVNLGELF
ncbi:MAG: BamA/TamA family outer membrane protein [Bacteroidetes bacterium]|nr:BamA/TamA family outer membrane protein [Bacteroidota bacterium]